MSDLAGSIFDAIRTALRKASRLSAFLVGLVVGIAVGIGVSYVLPPYIQYYTLQATINAQKEHISTLQDVQKRLTEDKSNLESKTKE
jgi:hypothetical protein